MSKKILLFLVFCFYTTAIGCGQVAKSDSKPVRLSDVHKVAVDVGANNPDSERLRARIIRGLKEKGFEITDEPAADATIHAHATLTPKNVDVVSGILQGQIDFKDATKPELLDWTSRRDSTDYDILPSMAEDVIRNLGEHKPANIRTVRIGSIKPDDKSGRFESVLAKELQARGYVISKDMKEADSTISASVRQEVLSSTFDSVEFDYSVFLRGNHKAALKSSGRLGSPFDFEEGKDPILQTAIIVVKDFKEATLATPKK